MDLRRLLRGSIDPECLDAVSEMVVDRYGEVPAEYAVLDANNWLSTPLVVNDRFFVKVISRQHSLVHALLTTGRNLGAYSSGSEGFFNHFETPVEMAEHEYEATEQMQKLDVNVPDPLDAFEYGEYGVVVMEYLPEFETFDDVPTATVEEHAANLFRALSTMHDAGLAHGDLRAENVLVSQGELFFIDATSVDEDAIREARGYDVACGLAILEPLIGPNEATEAAATVCDRQTLVSAREFLDFVNIRPDHQFDAVRVRGAVEASMADRM